MNRFVHKAGAVSLVTTLLVTLLGTAGSGAAAEPTIASPFAGNSGSVITAAARPLDVPPSSQAGATVQPAAPPADGTPAAIPPAVAASSLEQLVATRVDASELTHELKCLAGAIYFESRSESLEGQLAVGRVVVARTRSGRFPASYCGVVYQPSQFSFIRGQTMPSVNTQSPLWQRAVAMARIADAGSWQSPAEGALFFHAARITSSGRMKRVTQIDHHIFYQ